MRILILTRQPFPNGPAATKRIICYAKSLINEGVECEVVVFTRTEVFGKKPKNISGSGIYEGIPFRYVSGRPLRESNVFLRRWNDYLDLLRLNDYCKAWLKEGDCVLCYDIVPEWILRNLQERNITVVRELCELPFGTEVETRKTIKARNNYERTALPMLDGIIAISDELARYAARFTKPECKIIKIPILVDYDEYAASDRSADADVPYIFHAGTLYEQKDGFPSMLEAFGMALDRLPQNAMFRSTGVLEGSRDEAAIREVIRKYRLEDRVEFLGFVTNDELKRYLAESAFVVINKHINQQNRYCFSTKLGEYLAASKPIVVTRVGEAMNWLKDGYDCLTVEPDDIAQLSDAMVRMFTDSGLRKQISANAGVSARKYFDYRIYGSRIVDAIKSIKE